MSNSVFHFPDQTIPETKKDKEWHIMHGHDYVLSSRNSFHNADASENSRLLRAYSGIQNEEERERTKVVTHPHDGISNGVEYQVYNLIEQKIEQLVGDYLDRPMIRKAYVMNKKAQSRKLDAKIDMLSEQFFREMAESFKKETGVEISTPNPEMEVHKDVDAFFSSGAYKDAAEEVADDLITKFLDVDRNLETVKDFLTQYFIYDKTSCSIEIEDGKIKWKMDDVFLVDYDLNPDKVVQDDPEWYVRGKFMTENDIYNAFTLTKKEKKAVRREFEAISAYHQNNGGLSNSGKDMTMGNKYSNERWYVNENHTFRIFVMDMVWKSPEIVRAKKWINSDGNEVTTLLKNPTDRVKKGEELIMKEVERPRHVVMCGPDICLSWGLEEHRLYSIDNPLKCRLGRVAINRQNTLGINVNRSVAQKLINMQEWASEILYELRFAMRKNKGKAFVYDTAQTPRAYLKGSKNPLQRVLHHIGKDQIIFINSKEQKNNYAFNQFTNVDLSNQNHINSLIEGLVMVEELADRMIGFTPGRQGNADKYTTATNVESQRRASFSRTEIYYRPFDEFIKSCLEVVLMKSKYAYKQNQVIQYVIGDLRTKFLRMSKEFFGSDIGLYFGDPAKDMRKSEIIDGIATQSLGNAQTPEMISALVDLLFEETAVEKKKKLAATIEAMKEMAEQRRQEEMQMQQQAVEAQQANEERKDGLVKRGQDKDIAVANIYADNKKETEQIKGDTQKQIKAMEGVLNKN